MRKHLLLGHGATHFMPRKQLPVHCCLQFWFMDKMTQSTKPTASGYNNSLSKRQREGHPDLNEVQCQPFFFFTRFYWAVEWLARLCRGAAVKEAERFFHTKVPILLTGPFSDGGSIQPGS